MSNLEKVMKYSVLSIRFYDVLSILSYNISLIYFVNVMRGTLTSVK